MTFLQIARLLREAGIENSREEARLLIAFYTGKSPADILLSPDEDSSLPALAEGVRKRQTRVPLHYIGGATTLFTGTYK
ncbi:MAG: hypothetical protein MJ078_06525, partial [Clostridia bacterium]|nr:hypothetical protein [Clostridia bacterium]